MSVFSEYKAIFVSVAASLTAFFIFLFVLMYMQSGRNIEEEHRIVQSLFPEEKILLYNKSIQVPEFESSGTGLSAAFDEEFATRECLILANNKGIELKYDLLPSGNITVFDDDWYAEIKSFKNFQQTLFAEGYFGVVRVSRPCYNEAHDKAIIYQEQDCGPGCGSGEVVLLMLENGKWRQSSRRIVSVAG